MAITLTLEKAQSMIEAAIAEKGKDYVYPPALNGETCKYVDVEDVYDSEGEAHEVYSKGCIVGHAFINELGLDLEELAKRSVNEQGVYSFIQWLKAKGHITGPVAQTVEDYFLEVQTAQDKGRPWGEAYEMVSSGHEWNNVRMMWMKTN